MDLKGYFDNNATTPLCAEAKAAWCDAVDTYWLNPSSPYRAAARVHVRLEVAREDLAGMLGVEPDRLFFNSGATEGNHAVFAHWASTLEPDAKVGVSPTEHPSVIEAAKHFFGARVVWLQLDANGAVDVGAAVVQIESGALSAVSVMAANNETGVLNPWAELAEVCRAASCAFHCDASQWIGKLPLAGFAACGYVVGCAHKFGGPRGVGFCVVPSGGGRFQSLQGGAQEGGRRAGTPDVAGALAMVAALRSAEAKRVAAAVAARDVFVESLTVAIPGVEVIAAAAPRLWNTLLVVMPAFASERWIRALEKRGFLVSAGAACATGKAGPSHVLVAMGCEAGAMRRVLRLSSSCDTVPADWDALLEAFSASYQALKSDSAGAGSTVISI